MTIRSPLSHEPRHPDGKECLPLRFLISPGSGLSGLVILMLSLAPCNGAAAAENDEAVDMRLWYQKPAGPWEEALPVGNGRLGAMVFGGTSDERIQFNEDSLWTG